jgi:hypothetical protein
MGRLNAMGDTVKVFLMKLRLDLLKHLRMEDIAEEALANQHRYKAEPTFSKTGKGFLLPASEEDRIADMARAERLLQKLEERARVAGDDVG